MQWRHNGELHASGFNAGKRRLFHTTLFSKLLLSQSQVFTPCLDDLHAMQQIGFHHFMGNSAAQAAFVL